MPETQQQEKTPKDAQGNELEMKAHIPEGTDSITSVEIDQSAKHNEIGEGVHKTSKTFGIVISQEATDAAGLTPEANAAKADQRAATVKSSEHGEKRDADADDKRANEPQGMEQEESKSGKKSGKK